MSQIETCQSPVLRTQIVTQCPVEMPCLSPDFSDKLPRVSLLLVVSLAPILKPLKF